MSQFSIAGFQWEFTSTAWRTSTVSRSNQPQSASCLLLRSEALQVVGDLCGAISLLENAASMEPASAKVLSFLSKQWTDHTYLPGMTDSDIILVNDKAIHYALAAQKADPTYSLAHWWDSSFSSQNNNGKEHETGKSIYSLPRPVPLVCAMWLV